MSTATLEVTAVQKSQRIAALDGWRGIAILLVLADHIQFAFLHRYVAPWAQTGQHGVTVFFVLSGYLITSKLLEGPINLKHFYLRRFFRLMPVAWAYLAFLSVLTLWTGIHFTSLNEVRSCLLLYRNLNFPDHDFGLAGHFWTLSLEEQFYLVWPCVLVIVGFRRSRWCAAAGIAGVGFYRWMHWAHYNNGSIGGRPEVRADALLVGCLLAMLLRDRRNRRLLANGWKIYAPPCFAAFIYGVNRCHALIPLYECIAIALLIGGTCVNSHWVTTNILSLRPLTFIGVISYSLYVWQEFFMIWNGRAEVVVLLVFLPAFTLASYVYIEEPCRKLGYRLTRKT